MFLSQINDGIYSKIKEQATQGELASIDKVFEKVRNRIENESKTISKPEFKELNDIVQNVVQNVVEKRITPILQQILDDISRLTTTIEKSVDNNGNMIKVAFNEVSTSAKGMFDLQESKVQNLAENYLKQLDERINDINHGAESNSSLILQKADKINGAVEFVKNDMGTLWAKFDEQLQYMKTKKNVFPDNIHATTFAGKEPKQTNRDSFFEKNTTLQNDANMPKNKNKNKNNKKASNEETIPGTAENAAAKNQKSQETAQPGKKLKISIVDDLVNPGETYVQTEFQDINPDEDWQTPKSKNMKRKLRKRRKTDKMRAQAEVLLHGVETTRYNDGESFHVNEAMKAVEFLEEISKLSLGSDGIDIKIGDIVKSNRLDLWAGQDKFKPMVVQFVDIETANAVMKTMKIAGYLNKRTHVNRGIYRRTGDKRKNKENQEIIKTKSDCYGTPSSTKAERELYRKKKLYKKTPEFIEKTKYQDRKKEREVNYADIAKKYDLIREEGKGKLVEKPSTVPSPEEVSTAAGEQAKAEAEKAEAKEKSKAEAAATAEADAKSAVEEQTKNEAEERKKAAAETKTENVPLIAETDAKNEPITENAKNPSSIENDDLDQTVTITKSQSMPATYGNQNTKITPPSEPAASEPVDSNLMGFGNSLRNDLKQQAKFSERKSVNSTLTDINNNNDLSKITNPELDISGSGLFENDKSGLSQQFSASTPNHSSNNMCFTTPDTEITGAAVNTFAKICEKVIPKTLYFKT